MPSYLKRRLTTSENACPYSLRNNNDFNLKLFRNNKSQSMLFYKGLKIYNELPNNVKI